MQDTLTRLTNVFRAVFDDDGLHITPEMTAHDVDNWDSLMHVTLMVNVEKAFDVRFTSREVASLKSVGELVALIERRR